MKKSSLCLFLVSGALLLSGCDFANMLSSYLPANSNSGSESGSVSVAPVDGGDKIELKEGLKGASDAIVATLDADKIGLSLSVPNASLSSADLVYTTDVNAGEGEENRSVTTAACHNENYSLSGLTLSAAASGLSSDKHEDLKASASASATNFAYTINDVDIENKQIGNSNVKESFDNVSAKAYVVGDDAYLSLEGESSLSMYNKLLGASEADGTIAYLGVLSEVARPLIGASSAGTYSTTALSIMESNADFFSKYLTAYSYDDGTKAIHSEFGSTAAFKMAALYESVLLGGTYDEAYAHIQNYYGQSSLKLTANLTYDATGVTKFVLDMDGTLIISPTLETSALSSSVTRNVTTAHTYKFSLGLDASLSYGDAVVPAIPEDLASY